MGSPRETISAVAVLLACASLLVAPSAASAAGPQIEESWVQGVTPTGATLFMRLHLNGIPTSYYFEYITDAAYRANPKGNPFAGAAKTAQGEIEFNGSTDVSPPLSAALVPSIAYHYRPVAFNSEGTTVGGESLEHIFVTEEFGKLFHLPDDRSWEMVSPADKNGGGVAPPGALFGGGDLQAAATTATVTYSSATSFGDAAGAAAASQYVSRRGQLGWTTENISPPVESGAYGDSPDGVPYRLFSTDLSRALLFGGLPCRGGDLEGCAAPNPPLPGSGAPAGYMAYYLRDDANGAFASLLSQLDVSHSAVSPALFALDPVAASPDLSHIVLSSCARLTSDATEVPAGVGRCNASSPNLYEWSAAGLDLVNLLPGASLGTPGAEIAAPIDAVSGDGSRIYWTNGSQIYLREADQTVQVDKPAGGGTFQTATPDGAFAFFTDASKHLHRFSAATGSATDLTPAGGVVGVLGASADGSYVYFQDAAGLELWHGGETTTVAKGASATVASDYPPANGTARVSSDGRHLAFISKAELSGFDNVDFDTKLPDAEVFIYSVPPPGQESLPICASCNPRGERPKGSSSIPGVLVDGSTSAYRPRALVTDGSRLFFDSNDALVQKDTDNRADVYEWQAPGVDGCARSFGCVSLLSEGSSEGGSFVDASASGRDVYFVTDDSLVGDDPGAVDLYDARESGGFPEPPEPPICLGDACQSLPKEPDDPSPSTLVRNVGNPKLRFGEPKRKKHRGGHRVKKHRGRTRAVKGGRR